MQTDRDLQRQIRLIATQVYIYEVKARSGENSFGKLQKRFLKNASQSNEDYWDGNSRVFYKYANGKKVIKNSDLINRIEKELPGTKAILNHPLWFILENPLADLDAIYHHVHFLSTDIQAQTFKKDNRINSCIRKSWSKTSPFYYIGMHNDLDALSCFLMVIREMEILERWHTYTEAKWFAHELYLRLAYFPPIRKVADKLYKIIYRLFIDRNNPFPEKYKIDYFAYKYSPPSFIGGTHFTNDKLSGILWNAQYYEIKEEDKYSQLKFLFWVCTFGIEKTHKALHPGYSIPDSQHFIEKLISAYKSTSPKHHLPYGLLLD